ncbi:FUSC family protein [Nocardiopsis xinjiangensis]|uniref:FUSC family protein n=1 Tax=Nocardiopsis xinjiangensis TaxID=124285 RepID=UPI00034D7DC8|nr:aromatic acid exporter family protein [Nocardiopsis xinjiangensis]
MLLTEALSERMAAARAWFLRARRSGSHELNTILGVLKGALAASVSWYIAYAVIEAGTPAFAPFTAVLMMQMTVYRSAVQSLRYIGAVVLGIAVQAFLAFLAGPDVLTFAAVALITLVIGRWRSLGEQGPQVPTAAFFAFSTFLTASGFTDRLVELGEIVLLVAVGCVVGTLVNLVLFPPMRHRSVEWSIGALSHSLCDLLGDLARGLENAELDERQTSSWRQRAESIGSGVEQTRASVRTARESLVINPARKLRKHRMHVSFEGYEQLVEALGRVASQVGSLARAMQLWATKDDQPLHEEFFVRYGKLIRALAGITHSLSQLDEDTLDQQAQDLCRLAGEAQGHVEVLAEPPQQGDPPPFEDLTQPYGILLIEARRLMDELQYSCDIVQYYVDERDR